MNNLTPFESFVRTITDFPADVEIFWILIGAMLLIGFVVYALFAILVVRQVYMMTNTFKTSAEPVLKILSFVHLFFAISIVFVTYAILF